MATSHQLDLDRTLPNPQALPTHPVIDETQELHDADMTGIGSAAGNTTPDPEDASMSRLPGSFHTSSLSPSSSVTSTGSAAAIDRNEGNKAAETAQSSASYIFSAAASLLSTATSYLPSKSDAQDTSHHTLESAKKSLHQASGSAHDTADTISDTAGNAASRAEEAIGSATRFVSQKASSATQEQDVTEQVTDTLSSKAQQATSRLPFMQGVRNALVFPLALIALPIAVSAKTFDEVFLKQEEPAKEETQQLNRDTTVPAGVAIRSLVTSATEPAGEGEGKSLIGQFAQAAPGGDTGSTDEHNRQYDIVEDSGRLLEVIGNAVSAVPHFFSSQTQQAANQAQQVASNSAAATRETARTAAQALKDATQATSTAVASATDSAQATAASAAKTAKDQSTRVGQVASDTARAANDQVKKIASTTTTQASQAADTVSDGTARMTSQASSYVPGAQQVKRSTQQGRNSAIDTVTSGIQSLSAKDSSTGRAAQQHLPSSPDQGIERLELVGEGGLAATIADDVAHAAEVSTATSVGSNFVPLAPNAPPPIAAANDLSDPAPTTRGRKRHFHRQDPMTSVEAVSELARPISRPVVQDSNKAI